MNVMCWGEFDNNDALQTIEAEFHFNYWPQIASTKSKRESYFDIGVKLNTYKDLTSLSFWFSTEFENPDNVASYFTDLGISIKDKETASLVFNKVLKVSADVEKPKQTNITFTGTGESFIIYELSPKNVKAENQFEGTILRISLEQLSNLELDKPIYIRFRLMGSFLDDIEKKIVVKNKLLQSAFTETSYVDFRFNDIRSCNNDLKEYLANRSQITINKVHFFFMARSDEEVIAFEPITARILEVEAWRSYLNREIDQVCVAYHWRIDKDKLHQNSCIISARYKVLQCNGRTIALYVLILFSLTILMNISSSFLYGWLHVWRSNLFP